MNQETMKICPDNDTVLGPLAQKIYDLIVVHGNKTTEGQRSELREDLSRLERFQPGLLPRMHDHWLMISISGKGQMDARRAGRRHDSFYEKNSICDI